MEGKVMDTALRDRLNTLEMFDDGADLAMYLQDNGYKGELKNGSACPVHNFLAAVVDEENTIVEVNKDDIRIFDIEQGMYTHKYTVSGAVAEFIQDFDNGRYTALEKE
jgi:hypothetical protein